MNWDPSKENLPPLPEVEVQPVNGDPVLRTRNHSRPVSRVSVSDGPFRDGILVKDNYTVRLFLCKEYQWDVRVTSGIFKNYGRKVLLGEVQILE